METVLTKLGEVRRAPEVGYKGLDKYIWLRCPVCQKERWVCLKHTRRPNFTGRCAHCCQQGMEHASNWRGGEYIDERGYVRVHQPEHLHASSNGSVKRAVLVLEAKLGRPLLAGMDSHHINEIKDDDRPENLEELSHGEHSSLHNKLRYNFFQILFKDAVLNSVGASRKVARSLGISKNTVLRIRSCNRASGRA